MKKVGRRVGLTVLGILPMRSLDSAHVMVLIFGAPNITHGLMAGWILPAPERNGICGIAITMDMRKASVVQDELLGWLLQARFDAY